MGTPIAESTKPLEIHLTTDDKANTITLTDSGVGMTREELVSNLGTIARSGSKAFVESMQNDVRPPLRVWVWSWMWSWVWRWVDV